MRRCQFAAFDQLLVLARAVLLELLERHAPVKITVSIGNFSGRKWVLKKWTLKMKHTASSASSLWMVVATLTIQPGMTRVKNVGNHRIRPVTPITATPQNTAK